MPSSKQIAIVAALHREVAPLVKHWRTRDETYSGRTFHFFESETENAVVVCGGIGPEAARRAADAVIALYTPSIIYSAGFAGAADPNCNVADILIPRYVIDARDSSRIDTGIGEGILVSFSEVASPAQKAKLRTGFNANAVDMEAAAVANAAAARGVRFAAVKAISDPSDFVMPPLNKFFAANGTFNTIKFTLFLIPRPWMWRTIVRLQKNSAQAARSLCSRLSRIAAETDVPSQLPAEATVIHRP